MLPPELKRLEPDLSRLALLLVTGRITPEQRIELEKVKREWEATYAVVD